MDSSEVRQQHKSRRPFFRLLKSNEIIAGNTVKIAIKLNVNNIDDCVQKERSAGIGNTVPVKNDNMLLTEVIKIDMPVSLRSTPTSFDLALAATRG